MKVLCVICHSSAHSKKNCPHKAHPTSIIAIINCTANFHGGTH